MAAGIGFAHPSVGFLQEFQMFVIVVGFGPREMLPHLTRVFIFLYPFQSNNIDICLSFLACPFSSHETKTSGDPVWTYRWVHLPPVCHRFQDGVDGPLLRRMSPILSLSRAVRALSVFVGISDIRWLRCALLPFWLRNLCVPFDKFRFCLDYGTGSRRDIPKGIVRESSMFLKRSTC